jgi:cytochrome P450
MDITHELMSPSPEVRADPYAFYARLRQMGPVLPFTRPFFGKGYLLTRYEDVFNSLKDPRLVNDRGNAVEGGGDVVRRWWIPRIFRVFQENMVSKDEPDHRRLRNLVHQGVVGLMLSYPIAIRMDRFFRRLVKLRREQPGDDLTSALIRAEESGDQLSEEELVSMIFLLLLARHETTVSLIGNGTLALLDHPDQLQKPYEHPELIDSAVEELLRYGNPVGQPAPRFAREDMEIQGHKIPKGSMVMALLASANRDEAAFENVDRLDIARDPNRHVAFGYGIHYCLGAPLARLEGADRAPQAGAALPTDAPGRAAGGVDLAQEHRSARVEVLPVAPVINHRPSYRAHGGVIGFSRSMDRGQGGLESLGHLPHYNL